MRPDNGHRELLGDAARDLHDLVVGDGVERVEGDGTIVLTQGAAEAARKAFGVDLERIAPGELEALAERLR